ncbi:hypothetical protein AM228_28765 [Planktothricoides sp. SR001]|nr:hypothetical protein AM228_28765 [Planktothricoides sp. SR001]
MRGKRKDTLFSLSSPLFSLFKDFIDLLDTIPVGVKDMDKGGRFDSGGEDLPLVNVGVNDDQFAPLPTLVGSGARAIFFLG